MYVTYVCVIYGMYVFVHVYMLMWVSMVCMYVHVCKYGMYMYGMYGMYGMYVSRVYVWYVCNNVCMYVCVMLINVCIRIEKASGMNRDRPIVEIDGPEGTHRGIGRERRSSSERSSPVCGFSSSSSSFCRDFLRSSLSPFVFSFLFPPHCRSAHLRFFNNSSLICTYNPFFCAFPFTYKSSRLWPGPHLLTRKRCVLLTVLMVKMK